MLLSISFEPDLSHTSILYYYHIIELYNISILEASSPAKNEAYFLK
jgi:hypothetical protein